MQKRNILFFICFIIYPCFNVTSELQSSKKPFYSIEEWIQLLHSIFPQDREIHIKIVSEQSLLDLADKPFDLASFTAAIKNIHAIYFPSSADYQKYNEFIEYILIPRYDDRLIDLEKINLYTQKEFRPQVSDYCYNAKSISEQIAQKSFDYEEIEQALLAMFSYICNASQETEDYAYKQSETIETYAIHEINMASHQTNTLVRRPDIITIKPISGDSCHCNLASNCAEITFEEFVRPTDFPEPIQLFLTKILEYAQKSSIIDPLLNRPRSWYRGDRIHEIQYFLSLDDNEYQRSHSTLSTNNYQASKNIKRYSCRIIDNRSEDKKNSFLTTARIPLIKPIENYFDAPEQTGPFPQIVFTKSLKELSLKKNF